MNSGARPQLGGLCLSLESQADQIWGEQEQGRWTWACGAKGGIATRGSRRAAVIGAVLGTGWGVVALDIPGDKASCHQWLPLVAREDKAEQGKRRRRKQETKEDDGRRKWRCSRSSHEWEGTRYQELVD